MSRPRLVTAAVLVLLAGCGGSSTAGTSAPPSAPPPAVGGTTGTPPTSTPAPAPSSAPAATPAAPTTTAISPPPAPASTAGAPVPAHLQIADLSWVSASQGFLLGATPTCTTKPCTVVLGTTDGGTTWSRLGTPKLTVPLSGNQFCDKTSCAGAIRFASAKVGYVFGGGVGTEAASATSALTTDGGATWTLHAGPPVVALEPGPKDVLRVTSGGGCPPGCTFHLQRSSIGSTAWSDVATPAIEGNVVTLLRAGDDDYLVAYKNPAGGAQSAQPQWVVSHDGGGTWGAGKDPCLTLAKGGDEVDSADAVAAPGGVLTVLCSPRTGMGGTTLLRSTDAGRTFTTATTKANVGTLVQLDGSTLLTVGTGEAQLGVLRSTDGGATATSVLTLPTSQPVADADTLETKAYAGSQDAMTARVVPTGVPAVFTTTDGGATWTSHAFG